MRGGTKCLHTILGQSKPLVEKKQAPAELAKGGDSLAKSMDEVLDLLGAA